MSKERIRKLAKRYDLPVEKVVGLLTSLGHGRYRSADDMLPDPIVHEIEPLLQRARATMPKDPRPRTAVPEIRLPPAPEVRLPDEIPDDPVLNAALQEYRSARPLMELRKTLPAQPANKEAPAPAAAPRSKEDLLRDSLGAEIRQRRLLGDALEQARAELVALKAVVATHDSAAATRDAALKAQLEQARQRLIERENQLEADLAVAQSELEQLRTDEARQRRELEAARARMTEELVARQVAEGRISTLERRIKELEARPEPVPVLMPAPAPAQPAPLDELFEQRGLSTPDDVRGAMEALLREGMYHETMELLATSSPSAFRALLRRRLAILCENCEPPPGVAVMRVSDLNRCEVCRGSSTAVAARSFLAACKLRSFQRVNVVGGSPRYLTELRQLLGGTIDLRGIDGTGSLDARRARQHVEGADLTLVWGATILDHKVSNLYTDMDDPRVVQVRHRGIGGMLRLATEAVERRWPRGAHPNDERG